jgi:hypothetical protein
MRRYWAAILCACILSGVFEVNGEEASFGGSLDLSFANLLAALPPQTHLLLESLSIERFLAELDGSPPDWAAVYGGGHHDSSHDDRLFALNRERDARREGNAVLSWIVTFAWPGELSPYDADVRGFRVAVGPKLSSTRWGIVRFKPEEVPGNLVVIADAALREKLQRRFERRQRLAIEVVMTGRFIPEESLVYDFSHDEEGRGLIMPVVRVERVDFLLNGRGALEES